MNEEPPTRGEPDEPLCWFCETRLPGKDSASRWDMYREFEPLPGVWSYEPAEVPVPRCEACQRAHDRREQYVEKGWKAGLKFGLGLGSVLLLATLLANWGDVFGDLWGPALSSLFKPSLVWLLLAFVFFCAVAGGIVGWLAGKSSLPPGVKDQSAATLHPNVKGMEAQGWTLGRTPPRR
jgi:hypothetical protein